MRDKMSRSSLDSCQPRVLLTRLYGEMVVGAEALVGRMAGKTRSSERDLVLSGVFREQYRALVGLACLLLDERDQAEEVVQEAFARTYVAWQRLEDPSAPMPYLQRTVVN